MNTRVRFGGLGLLALVLAGCSTSQAGGDPPASAFVGEWSNPSKDGSISRLVVAQDAAGLHVHGYGQCTPECDWGVADTSAADAADGNIVTTWPFSDGDFITITLLPTDAHTANAHMNDHYSGVDHLSDHELQRP